jgi:hypothetical protein
MTEKQDMKSRLGQLKLNSKPSLLRKTALRDELISRGHRRAKGRSLAMAVMVVAIFGVTVFDDKPLESFNFGLNLVGTIGPTVIFEGQSPQIGVTQLVRRGPDGYVIMSEETIQQAQNSIELFRSLHLAGLTQLEAIFGQSISGRTSLTARYSSLADTLSHPGTETIIDQFKETDPDWEEIDLFYENRYEEILLSTIYDKKVLAAGDSTIVINGVGYPVPYYIGQDSILGEIRLWHYKVDSTQH